MIKTNYLWLVILSNGNHRITIDNDHYRIKQNKEKHLICAIFGIFAPIFGVEYNEIASECYCWIEKKPLN